MATSSIDGMHLGTPLEGQAPNEPSRQDLIERAQALGRRTWATMTDLRVDPLLAAKSSPRVASRRATLRNVVYATMGACIACSLAALVGGGEPMTEGARRPSTANTPVETIDNASRAKAPPRTRAVGAIPRAPTLRHRR